MAAASSNKSFCFYENYLAKKDGIINNDEYYHHLFDHFTGKIHEDNIENCTGKDKRLNRTDLLADLVQGMVKNMEHVEDATPFELVFKAYHTGTLEDVIAQHDILDGKYVRYIRQLLATQALLDRRADVLHFCLGRGDFDYEYNFTYEADLVTVDEHPKTFAVLERSEFRELHPRSDPPWVAFDVGGDFPVDW
ncbi:uncharacterized protein GGS22DRAFT_115304 [Annulohypoxylon maeteangense]|uniref:uncharacterized protein n=1 Tax=Annulohypoxylon maeteangense TaxID=1927788 RepID=UPI0020075FC7|nr:uncharacterized protein GGS22DRAFT_115304 [Annulohypoxylon maeteangense]KAI0886572.1 hypothetical protein GGS22DRAFT_115304 [Annulohypoxylon maeteangense]